MREPRHSRVFATIWELKKNGRAESTLAGLAKRLRMITKDTDIDDPEGVKEYIASKQTSNTYKEGLAEERIVEALRLYVDAMTNAIEVLRQALAKLEKQAQSGLSEVAFNLLKWEASKGSKLGEFECAFKASNMPDKWNHVFNILRANNATIKNHFAPEGFTHRYWLYLDKYQDRIFRKRREPPK